MTAAAPSAPNAASRRWCCCGRCRAHPPSTTCGRAPNSLSWSRISVLLTFYPGWVPIGLVAALVLIAARLAHIPRGALPSVPRWLWVLLALGGITAAFAGGSPVIHVGSVHWSDWAGC